MRCQSLILLAGAFGASEAFVSTQPLVGRSATAMLAEADGAAVSGLRMVDVRKTIDKLTKDNFEESLAKIEPFLLNEAGSTIYSKSMRRLAYRSKELGLEMPANYAKDAKCTKARREKQNAFIQAKEEERLAAEAEAAEAAAAEANTAEETVEGSEPVAA